MKVNSGHDQQGRMMGGDGSGITGTATSTTATSLTDTGASFVASAHIGHVVVAGTVYGVITSNTGTVLTVDRWYNPVTPGGAAGATPSGTATYMILPGGSAAQFVAVTANATAPAAGDTTLAGEIVTAGGGLIRKIATYAKTLGAASFTMTVTFTANGSDVLPVTIAKMGAFTGMVSGQMVFESLITPTAVLSGVGDNTTITQTITM